jgi:AcrR family transcriptional regulator
MSTGDSLVAAHPSVEPLLGGAAAGQRARLLEGMTRAVFEKGYAAATVADAVRHARVSRGTFYAVFASKEACFLEAYRHGVEVLHARITAAALGAAGEWRAELEAGLRAYLDTLADEPLFARTYLMEIQAAGPAGQLARDEALRGFARRYAATFRAAARADATLRVPAADVCFVLAAGIDEAVCAHVRAHGHEDVRTVLPTLMTAAATVLFGAAEATKETTWT